MMKRNREFDYECVDRIAGEIINTNDNWAFVKELSARREEYNNAEIKCYGNGVYEIVGR